MSTPAEAGRARARRLYPNLGTCAKCRAPASDRHHIDGDTFNNRRSNIEFLCRSCHMREDGRLESLRFAAMRFWHNRKPPRCSNCGLPARPARRGRCGTCSKYWYDHGGKERPRHLLRRVFTPITGDSAGK